MHASFTWWWHKVIQNRSKCPCSDASSLPLAGCPLLVGAVTESHLRYKSLQQVSFVSPQRITSLSVVSVQEKRPLGLLQNSCLWPSVLRVVIKCFAYAVMILPTRLKHFAGIQQSFSWLWIGAQLLPLLLVSNWKSKGFRTQGHSRDQR